MTLLRCREMLASCALVLSLAGCGLTQSPQPASLEWHPTGFTIPTRAPSSYKFNRRPEAAMRSARGFIRDRIQTAHLVH